MAKPKKSTKKPLERIIFPESFRVLSLDASTSTIGVAVIDWKSNVPTLVHCEYYKPPKKGDVMSRLAETREFIIALVNRFTPDYVALEDIIQFMQGHSTAKTIIALTQLNRTVGVAALNALGKPPALLNVMTIRHAIKKDKVLPKKEEVPELVASILGIRFPYIVKKNKRIVENGDIADAIAVGLAFVLKNRK